MVDNSSTKNGYREFLVQPKAARREALALAGVIGVIILLMGLRFSQVSPDGAREQIRSYQIKSLSLKNQAPTLHRALLGVVEDVMDLREETGEWPQVSTLKEEGLPPFAENFLPIGLRGFVWERHQHDGWVDYFGRNDGVALMKEQGGDPLENSFILRIIDLQSDNHPHPHLGKDNSPDMRRTAQIWINPQVSDYPGATLVARGWKWIVAENFMDGETEMILSEEPGQ